jgi:bacterioferritin
MFEQNMDKAKSIQLLNKAVADELQAVHQYMYFHFHLDDQGFTPLSSLFKRIAIEEMGHVEALSERILFLKGDVEMVPAAPVEKIAEPEAVLVKAMAMEEDGIRAYNEAALACGANADAASKQLFERLVADEGRRPVREAARQHQTIRAELPRSAILQRRDRRKASPAEWPPASSRVNRC